MEIIRVQSAGFCFGVKRAIRLAKEVADKYQDKNIYTFGPIIHNNDVVRELENKGIRIADNPEVKESVIILRSHGIEKQILEKLKKNRNIIIDATCPFVKKIHKCVELLTKENYFVVIIGDRGHPEVKGIKSYAEEGNYIIIENKKEIENMEINKRKLGVVVQTTQETENYLNICDELLKIKGEIRIFNTICDSTSIRQMETMEVAKKSDIMIVIGGKHSANTRRLVEISKLYCREVYHVENEKELKEDWFKNKKVVGVTGGASTPDYIIDKVIEKIRRIK